MRGWIAAILLAVVAIGAAADLATAASATPAEEGAPGRPDLALCPALEPLDEPLNDRTGPLAVPRSFAMLINVSRDQFAVATIYGGTTCIDTRAMTGTGAFTLSADRRFLEFDWTGYETGGHILVDRTGRGQVIETGASPISSPSRRRFAAVQHSEAAFGALEGFGVWQIGVVGVRQLALLKDLPSLADWRIDGWAGDDCIELSGIAADRSVASPRRGAKVARERYAATMVGGGWILLPSTGGCPSVPAGR